jgi:hypothetical protein
MCFNHYSLVFKSNCQIETLEDQIQYFRQDFIKHLKNAFYVVKDRFSDIKSYQTIHTHLLRKYFITQTNAIKGKTFFEMGVEDDYFLYIAPHKPKNPMFLIYDQRIKDIHFNFLGFFNFIELSL